METKIEKYKVIARNKDIYELMMHTYRYENNIDKIAEIINEKTKN